jgi:hypothetical protein
MAATEVTVVSPTQIDAVTGAATKAGTYSLFVIPPAGSPSKRAAGGRFTYPT